MNEIRTEEKDKYPDIDQYPPLIILDAIKAYCFECSGYSATEVKHCIESRPQCPLIYYRFGKNPFRKKKELSEKQLETLQAGRNKLHKVDDHPVQ
ncbi:MAG: hypothetical protein EOM12_09535 [Verrucomicrobiae bacterium]|nr:hypothetical protein [Verrucomicrobiae bacterium]